MNKRNIHKRQSLVLCGLAASGVFSMLKRHKKYSEKAWVLMANMDSSHARLEPNPVVHHQGFNAAGLVTRRHIFDNAPDGS
ncbi:hypothetical protein [Pseudomonas graminis]